MIACHSTSSDGSAGTFSIFPLPEVKWYCVHTKPLKEAAVASFCSETLGLGTYYPRLRQYRTIRRVRRLVCGPLFPRYFFCRLDLAESYRAVRYAAEVIDLVHLGPSPAPVADGLIDELKHWAGDGGEIITMRPELSVGDTVEVTDGPLRGMPAVIVRTSNDRDRVAILLSLLQHGAQMTISRSQLRRLE